MIKSGVSIWGVNYGRKIQQTACFTGHRQIGEATTEVERKVSQIVKTLIEKGYQYFIAGGARGFDALASEVILNLKKTVSENPFNSYLAFR